MALKLVQGATTITLSGDGATIAGCTYVPESAKSDTGTVTESASVILTGTAAAIVLQIRAIEALFVSLNSRNREKSLFVHYAAVSTDYYRSEVVGGRVEVVTNPLTMALASGVIEVGVIWERRFFWEAPTLEELPLKNTSIGSPATGGVVIYNHDDAGTYHDNYVDILGSDVDGGLAAPLYLTLTNGTNGVGARRFYIANDVFYGIGSVLEAEDSDGSFTGTAAATASDGDYATVTWPTNTEHDDLVNSSSSLLLYWNLPTGLMTSGDGAFFNVLARFHSAPAANIYGKLRLVYPEPGLSVSNVLWSGPEFELEQRLLQNLGSVPIPPGMGLGYSAPLTLLFTVRAAASGSLDVDFFQVAGPDGLRRLEILGENLDASDVVTVNDVDGAVHVYDNSLGYFVPLIESSGDALFCVPGRSQRLRVLFDEGASTMTISRTLTVRAYYRPRRATL